MAGVCVNNGARHKRTDEGGGFANDVEEGEEEKIFASRGDLRNLAKISES